MTQQVSSELVWNELSKEIFAVLGMVTAKGEARTAGVVYIVHDRRLYISTRSAAWKTRHIQQNPNVSVTVPMARRIPFLPWIKIPAATITFQGTARVLKPEALGAEVLHALMRGVEQDTTRLADVSVIEVQPEGEFVTYGVGISLMDMRFPEKARGRAPVG